MSVTKTPLGGLVPQRQNNPHLILLHGVPAIGKTDFACKFPSPIVFNGEKRGADEQKVVRYPDEITTFEDLREALQRLREEPHDLKTLVVDKLEDYEPLIWNETISRDPKKRTTMVEAFDGFQKAYDVAVDIGWRPIASDIERLQTERRMNVVLISHSVRREWKDPQRENFDRWEPNVHKKAAQFLVGWCRTVLFMEQEVLTGKLDKGDRAKTKVIGGGERVIHTEFNSAYDAKNRLSLPATIPMGGSGAEAYAAFFAFTDPESIKKAIDERLTALDDKTVTDKVRQMIKESEDAPAELAKLRNRLDATIRDRAEKKAAPKEGAKK